MNDREKIEFYIANCKCCLLAQAMKTCPNCRFQIGLAEKEQLADAIPVSLPVRIDMFALAQQ